MAITATIQSSVGHPGEGLPVYVHGRRRAGVWAGFEFLAALTGCVTSGKCLHLSGYDIASIKLTPKIASINLPD